MYRGPSLYVRFWGIVDVFILTTAVFLVSNQDSSAAEQKGQREYRDAKAEMAALEERLADLKSQLADTQESLSDANKQLNLAKNEAEGLRDKNNAELARAETAKRQAEAEANLAKEQLKQIEEIVKEFDSAESAAKYRELKTQITMLDVVMKDAEIVAIGDQTFANRQFYLFDPVYDEFGNPRDKVNEANVEKFLQELNRLLASRASKTLTMVMLLYDGECPQPLRDRVFSRINTHLQTYSSDKQTPVVASSWIPKSDK